MNESSRGSVTHWLGQLKEGDEGRAQQELWSRYFARLAALARKKLSGTPQRDADEEDVVLSVFESFFRGASAGRFPNLHDRDGLWPLLVTMTARKAINQVNRQRAKKRDPAAVDNLADMEGIIGGAPDPVFAVEVSEQLRQMLDVLDSDTLREVACLKLEGHTNVEIAERLEIAERSVARKLSRIRSEWKDAGEDR